MAGEARPREKTIALRDVCVRITKGTTPTTLGKPFVERGINFVKSESITPDGHVDATSFAAIDAETHEVLARSILEEGDVLFSMAGVYLGKTAVVPKSILPANTNQAVGILRVNPVKADPWFVHYALSAPPIREYVRRSVAQSAQPNYNLRDIGNLPLPKRLLSEQRAIAHVLRTFDDKISLNRRMNETLEAIARAIFQSWFIDFEPVRVKAKGRIPNGLPPDIASLFPSEFVMSERGAIPKGWRVVPLSEVIELNPSRPLRQGALAPCVEMSSLPTRGHRPLAWPLREAGAGARFRRGDTLLARITPCLENGKAGYVDFLEEGIVAWGSTEYIVMRPVAPVPNEWGYLLARDEGFRKLAKRKMEGTTGRQRVSVTALGQHLVTMPPPVVLRRFGEFVSDLFRKMGTNADENASLANLRNGLLPRLLSGEISVRDIEARFGRRDR